MRVWRCTVFKVRERLVSHLFPVALARGKHLFPFRTEQLSPSAPMVLGLKGPGRVGRRRFLFEASDRPARAVRPSANANHRRKRMSVIAIVAIVVIGLPL